MYEESLVGKIFEEGVNHYPEGGRFIISDNGCNLLLYFSRPTNKQINLIKTSSIKIKCYIENGVIMILFELKSRNLMDAPYSIYVSKHLTYLPDLLNNEGPLSIYLIDASTGILKTKRLVTLEILFLPL